MTPAKSLYSASAVVCALVLLTISAFSQDGNPNAKCTFKPLTIHGPAGTFPIPVDLTDAGTILGEYVDAKSHGHGFLLSNGKFTSFSFPGSLSTTVHDMNNNGVIVGSFEAANISGTRAFMVHAGGFTQVNLPGFPNAPAAATGINDSSHTTGTFQANGSERGFLLRNGKLTILDVPGALGGTFPRSINNHDVIIGVYRKSDDDVDHAFMWQNGKFTDVVAPNGSAIEPFKISDTNDIVGSFPGANRIDRGFALDGGRFAPIDVANTLGSLVIAVNNHDQIIALGATNNGTNIQLGQCSQVF